MAREAGDGTVGKALEVLDRVATWGEPVRFTDLLSELDYPKATLYRLLQTLTRQGMVSYDAERQTYAPGMRLVRLAHIAWESASLAPIARPFIDALARDLDETVHLAQLDGGQVLYVDKRRATDPVQMFSSAGKVGPAYCTGVGKAMLAFLGEEALERAIAVQSFHVFTDTTLSDQAALRAELFAIRKNGYAFDREEHEPGIICVAKPILSERGQVLGAVSVTSTRARHSLSSLERYVPRLGEATTAIARAAQPWRFPSTEMTLKPTEAS